MQASDFAALVRERMALERGRIDKRAAFSVALAFPVPYPVAQSALGPLQIYRAIQREPGLACERAFLPDDAGRGPLRGSPRSYESLRPLGDFPVVAFSVAYELELAGVVQMLEAAGIPALRAERGLDQPVIVAGGPLTFANPRPLAPFVDLLVVGEADVLAVDVLRALASASSPRRGLSALASHPHLLVPGENDRAMPPAARCPDELLPAYSPICTPGAILSDMFLIEAARGCARSCAYCVMRRSPGASLRVVPPARILELVPSDARRVGLVGAGVSDHPQIGSLVRQLAAAGKGVGLSSLRAERLDDELVAALVAGGARSLTVALDGASDRLRRRLDRHADPAAFHACAQLARRHGLARLKLYLMLGLPDEQDEDVDEAAALIIELSRTVPVAVAVSPFCPKHHTPLAALPFAGMDVVAARLDRLRRRLRGRASLRAASARWAWVEHVLAQGGDAEGRAVLAATRAGGSFGDYRRAFARASSPGGCC